MSAAKSDGRRVYTARPRPTRMRRVATPPPAPRRSAELDEAQDDAQASRQNAEDPTEE